LPSHHGAEHSSVLYGAAIFGGVWCVVALLLATKKLKKHVVCVVLFFDQKRRKIYQIKSKKNKIRYYLSSIVI
jgi:hypothetical protein